MALVAFVGRLALFATFALATVPAFAYVNPNDSMSTVAPIAIPGRYPVACSNVEQDFSRMQPGETPDLYWEGHPNGGNGRYVTSLLVDPGDAIVTNITVPGDSELFGSFTGRTVPYLSIVCYPTSTSNTRSDYVLPNGLSVPHMQRGSDPPIFAEDHPLFPVLLFSSGLDGSPLSSDYIDAITLFASYGYIVIAPFHGDARFADIQLQAFSDFVNVVLHFSDYTAMQAVRPLSMSASLDAVLARPGFAARMDTARIGGFGASLGGETMMLMGGAQLTVTVGFSSKTVEKDTRLTAAAGYVPYFGQPFYPAFGRDEKGLDNVTLPYLAISGTNDTVAPLVTATQGMLRLPAPKELVALEGVTHGFDRPSAGDIFTWSLVFLGAYALDDPLSRAQIARMTQVSGGGTDDLLLDHFEPLPPGPTERLAVEYHNASLDHYFMTAEPAEAAMLDAGVVVPGWTRTGFDFKVSSADAATGLPACRFTGTPNIGPSSHVFTINPAECALLMTNPLWTYEGIAFRVDPPTASGDCPPNRVPVIRMYNNGKGGQANHRYLTSHSEIFSMLTQGWIVEGPVFCSIP